MWRSVLSFVCRKHIAAYSTKRAAAKKQSNTDGSFTALSGQELKKIIRECGVSTQSATTKSQFADRIVKHLSELQTTPPPKYILAIDIGVVNLGHVLINLHPDRKLERVKDVVVSWGVEPVDDLQNSYSPARLVENLSEFLSRLLSSRSICMQDVHVVIERQSWRPMTSTSQSIVRCAAIEATLFGMCSNKGVVKSISATLVANWNNLNHHGALKKKAAICRVIDILKNGDQISISKDLVDVFRASKKKDDMADAMLMGISYTQWRDNSWNLLAKYPVYTVQTSRTTTPLESLQNVDHDLPMMTASIQKEDPQKFNHSELSNNELDPPPDNQDSQDLLLLDTHKQPENNSYQGQTNAMSLVYAQSFIEEYINTGNLAKTAHRLSVSNANYFKAPQPYLMHIALQEFNRRLAAVVPGYSDISTEPTVSMPLSTTTLTDVIASGLRNLDPLSAPDMLASDGTLVLANLSGGERYRWFWNYHKKHFLKDGNSLTDLTECSWRAKAQEKELQDNPPVSLSNDLPQKEGSGDSNHVESRVDKLVSTSEIKLQNDTAEEPQNSHQRPTNAMSLIYAQSFIEEFSKSGNRLGTAKKLCDANANYFKDYRQYLMHIALQEFDRRLAAVVPDYSGISTEPTVSMPLSTMELVNVVAGGLRKLDPLSASDVFESNGSLVVDNLSGHAKWRWFWNYYKEHFRKNSNSLVDLKECFWRVKVPTSTLLPDPSKSGVHEEKLLRNELMCVANAVPQSQDSGESKHVDSPTNESGAISEMKLDSNEQGQPKNSPQQLKNAISLVYAQSFIEEHAKTGSFPETARKLSCSYPDYPKDSRMYYIHIALQEFDRRLAAIVPEYSGITTEPIASMPLSEVALMEVIANGLRNLDPTSAPDVFASDGTLVIANLSVQTKERHRWFWSYHRKHFLKEGSNSLVDLKECSWRVKAEQGAKTFKNPRKRSGEIEVDLIDDGSCNEGLLLAK